MVEKFLPRMEFDSYEDFKANYRLNIPEGFNFAYDVIDGWAEQDPDKPALVWVDGGHHEKRLSFGDLSRLSSQAACFYQSLGIQKGDFVIDRKSVV